MASRVDLKNYLKHRGFSSPDNLIAVVRARTENRTKMAGDFGETRFSVSYINSTAEVSEPLELDIMLGDISVDLQGMATQVSDSKIQSEHSFSLIPPGKSRVGLDLAGEQAVRPDILFCHYTWRSPY